jgi:ABC-type oligopeptide transport system substrate-binding subunit
MLVVLVHAGVSTMPVLTTKLRPVVASLLIAFSAMVPQVGSAATWADPAKVLRVALPTDITGLDPAAATDGYSGSVEREIFDVLYHWDYLERPFSSRVSRSGCRISRRGLGFSRRKH